MKILVEDFVYSPVKGEWYYFTMYDKYLYGKFLYKTPAWYTFELENGKRVNAKFTATITTDEQEMKELLGLVDRLEKDTKVPNTLHLPNRFVR